MTNLVQPRWLPCQIRPSSYLQFGKMPSVSLLGTLSFLYIPTPLPMGPAPIPFALHLHLASLVTNFRRCGTPPATPEPPSRHAFPVPDHFAKKADNLARYGGGGDRGHWTLSHMDPLQHIGIIIVAVSF